MREYSKNWSNYIISAIKYDSQRKRITHLKRRIFTRTGLSEPNIVLRENVIFNLSAGKTFCTAIKGENGEWLRGHDLFLIGGNFLKTEKNSEPADYISGVPEF